MIQRVIQRMTGLNRGGRYLVYITNVETVLEPSWWTNSVPGSQTSALKKLLFVCFV